MKLSRLNDVGVDRFRDWLIAQQEGDASDPPTYLLTDPSCCKVLSDHDVTPSVFANRFEAAEWLFQLVESAGLDDVEANIGLWAWLSLLHIDSVCPKDGRGRRKVGALNRYIPEPHNWQRYYRHLLALPFLVYRAHRDKPERAMCLLVQKVDTPGDMAEQLAARQDYIVTPSFIEMATRLYINTDGKPKHGAGGKSRGSPRRLATIINQFDLTWDLVAADSTELLELLPAEFNRFKA